MKSTFNICFYAKKDKQKANGAYPLFARITVDGVASRFNTKLDVLPSIWDGKMGKATGRTSEASRINRMLDDINASLNSGNEWRKLAIDGVRWYNKKESIRLRNSLMCCLAIFLRLNLRFLSPFLSVSFLLFLSCFRYVFLEHLK